MQIVAINPSRRNNQVWLKFDNQFLLPLKVDDVVVLKLKKFVDLSDDLYQTILKHSANFLIYEYSLRQIAISPKTKVLLLQKLKQHIQKLIYKYNFDSDLLNQSVNLALQTITSLGFLDDQKYVDHLIKRFPKKSATELNFKLKTLGINQFIPVSKSQELTKIKDLIQKKYKNVDLADYNAKNRLIAKLYRHGFALDFIKIAIDESSKIR